ncbi:MAG: type II toxin-antitoxin system VapC family toxin [Acidimicrobiales bacterium]
MIVVDASVLTRFLALDDDEGGTARALLKQERVISIPDVADVEAVSALRGMWLGRLITERRFGVAVDHLTALPLRRFPTRPLLSRTFELRHNLTPYDAAYVALAEGLGCPLVTADSRLARAPGVRCPVTVLTAAGGQ